MKRPTMYKKKHMISCRLDDEDWRLLNELHYLLFEETLSQTIRIIIRERRALESKKAPKNKQKQ